MASINLPVVQTTTHLIKAGTQENYATINAWVQANIVSLSDLGWTVALNLGKREITFTRTSEEIRPTRDWAVPL